MPDPSSTFGLSARAGRTTAQPINYLIATALAKENLISLAAGLVDQETLPTTELAAIAAELLGDGVAGRQSLQYGSTAGLPELRTGLLEWMCELDGVRPGALSLTPENVVVSSGSQQLLFILTDILVDPGDIVITGWPSYFVYTGVLRAAGAEVRGVDLDEDGMIPEALEATLAGIEAEGKLDRVKIVCVCDYYQNPTGITLSADRRGRILDIVRAWSKDHLICLIEDAAYRELHAADVRPPETFKSLEADNRQVVFTSTISKPFSPGLRTGYAFLPEALVEPVLNQKGNHDFGSSNFNQHLIWRALRDGLYGRHVDHLRRRYDQKREAMLAALGKHLGGLAPGIRWTHPTGGLYVYVTLPEDVDTGGDGPLFQAALDEGVLYVPGQFCYVPDATRPVPRNQLRLTHGTVDETAIDEGVRRLGRAVARVLGRGAYAPAVGERGARTP
jgi:2-aminoadipate transaminase